MIIILKPRETFIRKDKDKDDFFYFSANLQQINPFLTQNKGNVD